jgi:LysR family transcriptional regulator, nitrogen assimilation regulatory protein
MQKRLVVGGHGWTILPAAGIGQDVAEGLLSAAPLTEPEVWRSIVLGVPRTGRITPAAMAVATELVRQVRIAARSSRWPSAQFHNSDSDKRDP